MSLLNLCLAFALTGVSLPALANFELKNIKINGSDSGIIEAGQPAVISFQIAYRGEILNSFNTVHGKLVHVATFRSDLSHFSHVHPSFDSATAMFTLKVNQSDSEDVDNFMTPGVFPAEGKYQVHVEFYPNINQGGIFPRMEMLHFEAKTKNHEAANSDEFRAEGEDGVITKYLDANGKISKSGALYQVSLKRTAIAGDGGEFLRFEYFIREFDAVKGVYFPIKKLQTWLTTQGHALLTRKVSHDHDHHAAEKDHGFVYHMHSYFTDGPRAIRQLESFYFNRGEVTKGSYRLWLQIKPQHKVFTIPFSFEI